LLLKTFKFFKDIASIVSRIAVHCKFITFLQLFTGIHDNSSWLIIYSK